MTYQGPDVEVVNALTRQKGVDFDVHFTRDNPHLGEPFGQYKNMMLNWQKMQRLSRYYDKVWLVESDTIPPDDALEKLLETDGGVVNGLYASRYDPYSPSARKRVREPFSWEELKPLIGQTIKVASSGTGCSLIDRSILDRYSLDMEGYNTPEAVPYWKTQIDLLFSTWCNENGVEQKVRLDVLCGHRRADGKILWPQDFLN